jgi:glutamate dehydrogenase (NADP+)
MFGQYKRLRNEFTGVLTGKNIRWGGSLIRPEATGYAVSISLRICSLPKATALRGKFVQFRVPVMWLSIPLKDQSARRKCVSLSDSTGTIYDPAGINEEKLAYVLELKNVRRGRIKEYASKFKGAEYYEGKRPWGIKCDCAFPSATQNEISEEDAKTLVANGCKLVSEGANMPTEAAGVEVFLKAKILYGPGKAANAGGVAVSGLEMAQNAMHTNWSREEVDARLQYIMQSIHTQAKDAAERYGMPGNYVAGANIAGFVKVADSMIDQGVV